MPAAAILRLYAQAFSGLSRQVWVLSLVQFINRSGSMVLLFASLFFTKELHFSLPDAGLVMSCYGLGSIAGSYTGGWLTDRRNPFDIMVCSLAGSGLLLLLLLVVVQPWAVGLVVFFYALVADMFRPANSASMARFTTPQNRTRSVSLLRLAINLGFSVGPAVGGVVAVHYGYRVLFVLDSLTSLGAALLLFMYLPRQRRPIRSRASQPVLADRSTSAYADREYLLFIVLSALYATFFFQLFASVPQYFDKVCHYSESTIGLLLALNGLLVVLIEMPLVARFEGRAPVFRFIVWGVLFIPVAFATLWLGGQWLAGAVVYTLFITFAEILAMPFMMNFAMSRPPKERQGQYSALYSIAYGVANIAAPAAGLGIADSWGFQMLFVVLAAGGVFTAFGFAWLQQRLQVF